MPKFKVALIARDVSTREQPIPQWIIETFEKEEINFVSKECTTREEMAALAGDADVVWVFGDHQDVMTSENLDVLPQCGAIIRTGSGCDNVPVDEATKLGIIVANTPRAVSGPVSDHTIGLLFAVIDQFKVTHCVCGFINKLKQLRKLTHHDFGHAIQARDWSDGQVRILRNNTLAKKRNLLCVISEAHSFHAVR